MIISVVLEAVTPASTSLPFSKEVREFMKAAEGLVSPALRSSELTAEDCEVIKQYIITLSNVKQPWSKTLPIKYV